MSTRARSAIAALLLIFGVLAVSAQAFAAPPPKVEICHKPGTPAEKSLEVPSTAVQGHLDHGDTTGPCEPPPPPPQPCNAATISGGEGVTVTNHQLGQSGPASFQFDYETFIVPDQITIRYEGNVIFDVGPVGTNGMVSTIVNVPVGGSTEIEVTVEGPAGTLWEYTVHCPAP